MKWIITGGCGFIGSHTAARLHAKGHEVVLADNMQRAGSEANRDWLARAGVTSLEQVDIRDAVTVMRLMEKHRDADAVLHLAAQVAVTRSIEDPRADFEVNALGTLNLLEACRVVAKGRPAFLYSSTNKVYGGLEHLRVEETETRYVLPERPHGIAEPEPLDLHSPYGCSKGAADQYVRDYARIYGLRTAVFRQSCIYGTRQFGVEDQGWVAWFFIAAACGRPLTIYGSGKQVRDLLWAEDLADLYEIAAHKIDRVTGQVCNIGGGPRNARSLLEVLDWIGAKLGRPLACDRAEARPGDQKCFVADTRKAAELLGWSPATGAEEGLARLWSWVQENRRLFT